MNKTNCYHYVKMCVGAHRKEQDMWNYFFRVCILNRTSVYLRLFDYVSDYVPRSSH